MVQLVVADLKVKIAIGSGGSQRLQVVTCCTTRRPGCQASHSIRNKGLPAIARGYRGKGLAPQPSDTTILMQYPDLTARVPRQLLLSGA